MRAALWRTLESIVPTERSQTQKVTYGIIPFRESIRIGTSIERTPIDGCQVLEEGMESKC